MLGFGPSQNGSAHHSTLGTLPRWSYGPPLQLGLSRQIKATCHHPTSRKWGIWRQQKSTDSWSTCPHSWLCEKFCSLLRTRGPGPSTGRQGTSRPWLWLLRKPHVIWAPVTRHLRSTWAGWAWEIQHQRVYPRLTRLFLPPRLGHLPWPAPLR